MVGWDGGQAAYARGSASFEAAVTATLAPTPLEVGQDAMIPPAATHISGAPVGG